jgi:fermentation-respiration switch protein FrsA (DUF1100 family)
MSILRNSLISAAILFALPAFAQSTNPAAVAQGANVAGSQKVRFNNGGVRMTGNLYLPANYDSSKKYPAIVVAHPWGGVKEQTSGLYAQQLARKGIVTLAFDASRYGESGGEPGASHFDLYDKPQYVTPAVDKMAEFFGKHL